jgi:hypothetical protein
MMWRVIGSRGTVNKQNDTDLSGVITSILVLFYVAALTVGVCCILLMAA